MKARKMAPWLRELTALSGTRVRFPPLTAGGSGLPMTQAGGDVVPSSGLLGDGTHMCEHKHTFA